tara:strand:+ start:120 stop:293 length:174 start_codon:yes stop_codon:yes gene_type:complete
MTELTKLERLQKNVEDTATAYAAAYAAMDAAYDADAWDAYAKARLDLEEYLKEQDNE